MAFTRAVAADFDLDHLKNLILFAECFGATRLKDACIRFSELWKQKHVPSQLVEIEATEDTAVHGVSSTIVSGVMISDDQQSQNGCVLERKCKVGADDGFASINVSHDGGLEFGIPNMLNEGDFMQGNDYAYRYAQLAVPPSPAGLMFQQYYLQGMPGYTNYHGLDSIYHAQNVLMEDHGLDTTRKMKHKMTTLRTKDDSFNSEDTAVESLCGSNSDNIKNGESIAYQDLKSGNALIFDGLRAKIADINLWYRNSDLGNIYPDSGIRTFDAGWSSYDYCFHVDDFDQKKAMCIALVFCLWKFLLA